MNKRQLRPAPRFNVKHLNFDSGTATINITYTPAFSSVIVVSRSKKFTLKGEGKFETAINWSAMGDVSIAEAKAMLESLKLAIQLAEGLEDDEAEAE